MRVLRFNQFLTQKLENFVAICWVRIDQRVEYELTESGCETSEPGYETSMGTNRLDTIIIIIINVSVHDLCFPVDTSSTNPTEAVCSSV